MVMVSIQGLSIASYLLPATCYLLPAVGRRLLRGEGIDKAYQQCIGGVTLCPIL